MDEYYVRQRDGFAKVIPTGKRIRVPNGEIEEIWVEVKIPHKGLFGRIRYDETDWVHESSLLKTEKEREKMAEWKFKEDVTMVYTDDFWYDLTDGGYLKPEEILAVEEQAIKLREAIDLVHSFQHAVEAQMPEE